LLVRFPGVDDEQAVLPDHDTDVQVERLVTTSIDLLAELIEHHDDDT
jgi:hypothetical protein